MQQHDKLACREDMRSPCYAAGNRSHTRCSEHAIATTGQHQEFWSHSHCTPDNTAITEPLIKPDLYRCISVLTTVLITLLLTSQRECHYAPHETLSVVQWHMHKAFHFFINVTVTASKTLPPTSQPLLAGDSKSPIPRQQKRHL